MLLKARNSVIKFFDDYYLIVSDNKYEATRRKGLKILTPNQMLQRSTVALTLVKVGDASENLINKIHQLIYSLYQAKKITKKVYNKIMNSIKL